MAIQPIDLQNMYSQMSNVSKVLSGSQQAQLTESMQQQSNIQKSIENASKVQQASNEQAESSGVNQDGHNTSLAFKNGRNNKNFNDDSENDSDNSSDNGNRYKSKYLGTIIDITR